MTLTARPDTASRADWPAEVDLIISALAAGEDRGAMPRVQDPQHRQAPRRSYRVLADLRLFSDAHDAEPWRLYTRDADARGLGFITPHRLPLGYGGTVELRAPDGRVIEVNCTLLRCREIAPGWFDGALYFNRVQPAFDVR